MLVKSTLAYLGASPLDHLGIEQIAGLLILLREACRYPINLVISSYNLNLV